MQPASCLPFPMHLHLINEHVASSSNKKIIKRNVKWQFVTVGEETCCNHSFSSHSQNESKCWSKCSALEDVLTHTAREKIKVLFIYLFDKLLQGDDHKQIHTKWCKTLWLFASWENCCEHKNFSNWHQFESQHLRVDRNTNTSFEYKLLIA